MLFLFLMYFLYRDTLPLAIDRTPDNERVINAIVGYTSELPDGRRWSDVRLYTPCGAQTKFAQQHLKFLGCGETDMTGRFKFNPSRGPLVRTFLIYIKKEFYYSVQSPGWIWIR